MINQSRTSRNADCQICYGSHDEEIHEATLRVRTWFHHQVTRHLYDDYEADFEPCQELEEPVLASDS